MSVADDRCDVLIVGGGPAGSSLAWGLRGSGLDVVVLDRRRFPRDKVCAGWVTPPVFSALSIDPADYAQGDEHRRVIEPIRGFALSRVEADGGRSAKVDCGEVVSFGIRRCEFDHYLLERAAKARGSAVSLRLGEPMRGLRRDGAGWRVELERGEIAAGWLVGAGGHFCPVARHLGARPGAAEPMSVVAREIELEMTPDQRQRCPVRPELPELFFAEDLRGYGWLVRKGDWLNVGLGRQDPRAFPRRVEEFLDWLERRGRLPPELSRALRGHAYLLYGQAPRPLAVPGALLIGDAAGLAYGRSGEGIRPAVESGLLAARALGGADDPARSYADSVVARFGRRGARARAGASGWLPSRWRGPLASRFLTHPRLARHVVVDRWFLHREVPPLL